MRLLDKKMGPDEAPPAAGRIQDTRAPDAFPPPAKRPLLDAVREAVTGSAAPPAPPPAPKILPFTPAAATVSPIPSVAPAPLLVLEAAPIADVVAQLTERFWKLKKSRIRMNGPAPNSRASSIGEECVRRLVYERTIPSEQRVPHGAGLQAIFDLGNYLENYVARELEDMGVVVVQRGRDYVDTEHRLSGHIDALLRLPGADDTYPAEIKGLNPNTAGKIKVLRDIVEHQQAWVRKYYAQLQTYLHFAKKALGIFVLFNKSTGEIVFIACPIDPFFVSALLEKAKTIQAVVDAGEGAELPARHETKECERCPFVGVCGPNREFGPGVTVLDDRELEDILSRREELIEAHQEYKRLDKMAKEAFPEVEETLVGSTFVVRGKQVFRRGYSVKPGSYWKFEPMRIAK